MQSLWKGKSEKFRNSSHNIQFHIKAISTTFNPLGTSILKLADDGLICREPCVCGWTATATCGCYSRFTVLALHGH